MMEAVRTSETSVDNHFTRQYSPEDSSEHHTRRRENLKSHILQITIDLRLPPPSFKRFPLSSFEDETFKRSNDHEESHYAFTLEHSKKNTIFLS
jgi:hypothetical protein